MSGNGVEALEGTEARIEDTPPSTGEKEARVAPTGNDAREAPQSEAPAGEAAAPTSDQAAIRSVFVARTTASSAASAGGFAEIEMSDNGFAVRSAYCAHVTIVEAEAVAVDHTGEGDVLRKAFLARAMADAVAPPRAKQRAARPAQRGTARRAKKAAGAKPKRAARPAAAKTGAKPKKRSAARAKAKPRAAMRRAAARPARRGKRRGR